MSSTDCTVIFCCAVNGEIELRTRFGLLIASSDAWKLALAVRGTGGFAGNFLNGVSTEEAWQHGFASQEAFDALYFKMFDVLREINWH